MNKNDSNFISELIPIYYDNIINNKPRHKKNDYIYKNILHCPLEKSDCITSLDIYNNVIIYGTIMGNVYLCHVKKSPLIKMDDTILKNNRKNSTDSKELYVSMNEDKQSEKIFKSNDETENQDIRYDNKLKIKLNESDSSKISCIKLKYSGVDNSNIVVHNNIFLNSKKNEDDKFSINSNKRSRVEIAKNKHKLNNTPKETLNEICLKNTKRNLSENENYDTNAKINENKNKEIPFPQITCLIVNAVENISCISFDTEDSVNISVGDFEIIRLEKISTFNTNDEFSKYDYYRIRNYKTEEEHLINCENSTIFLTTTNYLMVNTNFAENNAEISIQQISYKNKLLKNLTIIEGEIEMFNYSIPFDFDGDKFLFIDYQTSNIRRICIFYTVTKSKPYIFKITKDFGHISHMKILSDDRVFLCRDLTKCEIRNLDENFTINEKWTHIGDEIIAIDIFNEGTKGNYNSEPKKNNEANDLLNEFNKAMNQNISDLEQNKWNGNKVYESDNMDCYTNKNLIGVEIFNKKRKKNDIDDYFGTKKNKIDDIDEKLYIVTLDLEGNVNLFHNHKNEVVFNLYKIAEVDKDIKCNQRDFFELGFPYFILINSFYYAISTDYGLFIVAKYKNK